MRASAFVRVGTAFVMAVSPLLAQTPTPPPNALRILVTTSDGDGAGQEREARGRHDSAEDLRTRLQERLGKMGTIVSDPAQASVTVMLVKREILHDENIVRATLMAGDVSVDFVGHDSGMWGPAATGLAKVIARWIATNRESLVGASQGGAFSTGQFTWPSLKIQPGAEVTILSPAKAEETIRYFVSANKSEAIVLNPMVLPVPVRQPLRHILSGHPQDFASTIHDGGEFVEGTLRVNARGVFHNDDKVADLAQVFETASTTGILPVEPVEPASHHLSTEARVGIAFVAVLGGIWFMHQMAVAAGK